MELDLFEKYWFGSFGVVALLDKREPGRGSSEQGERLLDENRNWEEECLGTFYIRPNYPGMDSLLFPSNLSLAIYGRLRLRGMLTMMSREVFACL